MLIIPLRQPSAKSLLAVCHRGDGDVNAGERVCAAGQYFFPVFLMSEGGEVHPAVIDKLSLIMRVYGVEGHYEANGFRLTPPKVMIP